MSENAKNRMADTFLNFLHTIRSYDLVQTKKMKTSFGMFRYDIVRTKNEMNLITVGLQVEFLS